MSPVPAELAVTWQVGSAQSSGTLTITIPGTKIATASFRPVQNGTTTATVVVRDINRGLTEQRTLAYPIVLHCPG